MRAVTVREGALIVEQHPDPEPGHGQILVRVRAAGLVLCMAAEHRPFVLSYDRSAARRTFVLAAFARAAMQWEWLARSPVELVALAAEHARDLPGDDIDDPLGHPPEAYAACAERLDTLVTPVVAALARTLPVSPSLP